MVRSQLQFISKLYIALCSGTKWMKLIMTPSVVIRPLGPILWMAGRK